ncbi:probable serine/threonine-protein kinase PBL1 isoform X3 [Lactuca sativa]|uniref:probable serine/threonine-protein kinase PBL1 isoform X3 n=1 Tax=Lactuca sativa TaxID=4236 RepID=UPI001C69316E|nr:probable serine/threonine-protein kinase PBL1 isoform X3 [Lactuca sativa]
MALPRDGVPPLTDADIEEFDHLKIQMEDIISATDNFNPTKLIGRGGFGPVYKGELSLLTGPTMVAFKRLDPRLGQGNIEFWKEILMLSDCKHENLVSLLHFSIEGDERVLVYEYASHGSLDHYLSDSSLTWEQRLHICIGVAHSLKYLHDPMKTQQIVLHRDIKSANILLDEQWNAKVSDFGLSKIWPANQTRSYLFSHPVGTQGYCDPLYGETGFLSKESDVYSFGVVLFEVLCGRLCYKHRNAQINGILVHDWKRCYHEKKLDDIILKDLKEQINPDSLITFSTIANQCLNGDRRERPTMDEIVKELEVALEQQNIAYNRNLVEISKLAVPPLSYRSHDELILLLSKGILVDQGKRWLSMNKNKKVHEMISAAECVKGFVFQVTAKISRFSKIFCRKDGWLMAELYQFTSYQREHDFKIEFLSDSIAFSQCDIEGIEFRPMEHENLEDKNEVDVKQISTSDADWEQKVWPNYIDLINLSKDYIKWTTKKEHYFLLCKGFLIDNGEDKLE